MARTIMASEKETQTQARVFVYKTHAVWSYDSKTGVVVAESTREAVDVALKEVRRPLGLGRTPKILFLYEGVLKDASKPILRGNIESGNMVARWHRYGGVNSSEGEVTPERHLIQINRK